MANRQVTVTSPVKYFTVVMDETLVAAYIATAKTNGYFYNVDGTTEVYIVWEAANIVVVP